MFWPDRENFWSVEFLSGRESTLVSGLFELKFVTWYKTRKMADILAVFVYMALFPLLKFKVAEAQEYLENFFLSLQDLLTRIESTGSENPRFVEYLHDRLEGHVQIVFAISLVLASVQDQEVLKEMLKNLLEYLWRLLQDLRNKITSSNVDSCTVFRQEPSQTQSSGGRPRYVITREHIKTIRNTGMQWTARARSLGVSSKTLYRRRHEYGLQDSFSDITNEELEWNVRDILKLTPFSGESYIRGALCGRGIFIQRWKIREALQTVDPVGHAVRRRSSIQHWLYKVKKPNHLWHLDSNHKLINWGFVFHGCIDGFSRAIWI